MNREIEFRGQCVLNGEWLYGDLEYSRKDKDVVRIHTYNDDGSYKHQYLVVPDTVGQFTGLCDKNGVKIFEGDIVEVYDFTSVYASKYRGVVKMYCCSWCVEYEDSIFDMVAHPRLFFDDFADRKTEVVVQRKTKTEYDVIKEKTYKRVELTNAVVMYDKSGRYVGVFDNYRQSKLYLKIGDDYKVPFGREYRGVYLFHYNGGEIKKNIGEIKSKVVKTVLYDDIIALGDAENIGELISVNLKKEEKPKREKKPKVEKLKKEKKPKVIVVPKKKPRILKYTLDGKYVSTYNTTVEAAAADCVYPSAILACAKKKVRRCGDYIYRFEGDELDLPTFSDITLKQRIPSQKDLFE